MSFGLVYGGVRSRKTNPQQKLVSAMSLSKQYLSRHREPVPFDIRSMGRAIEKACPNVVFALLLGSAKDGVVPVGGDIDIALYVTGKGDYELYSKVMEIVDEYAPGVHCDIGILNDSEPVYQFAALKGRQLWVRDKELFLDFYSLTCREYESHIFDYERQHKYRMEAK